MGLETPEKIRDLQRKLYRKAKQEREFRFTLLYDKVYRVDNVGNQPTHSSLIHRRRSPAPPLA